MKKRWVESSRSGGTEDEMTGNIKERNENGREYYMKRTRHPSLVSGREEKKKGEQRKLKVRGD